MKTSSFLKTELYPDPASYREHVLDAGVVLLPGLLKRFLTMEVPSAQDFIHISLDINSGFGVYIIVMGKDE